MVDQNELKKASELRKLIQTFIRQFGLLSSDSTPCGRPLSVSYAHALMLLLEWKQNKYSPAQKDLEEALGIDKSNIARLCQRMEQNGHVLQEKSQKDKRSVLIRLTDKGKRLATEVEKASHQRFLLLLMAVPSESHQNLFRGLNLLNAAVNSLIKENENNCQISS